MPDEQHPPAGGDQPVVPPPAPAPPGAPPAQPATPLPQATAAAGGGKHWSRFLAIETKLGAWSFVVLIGILGFCIVGSVGWGLFGKNSIVRELASADLARGVITFIFAIGTIGIALLVTLGALVGENISEQALAKAKEVLTVLIGVFGTILGFYFGSATGGTQKLDVAEIKFADKQLITHISGGTRPYHYSITSSSSEKDFTPIKSRVSDDGWIIETLSQAPKPKSTLTVDVTDGKDQKASQKLDIPDTNPTPTSPTQKPETTGTPPTTTPGTTPPTR